MLNRSGYDYYMSEEKNPAAVELGRLGGKKGGKARAEKLSPERRKEIARKLPRHGRIRIASRKNPSRPARAR